MNEIEAEKQHGANWYSDEWSRLNKVISQLETLAITFLMTTNGGGAVAILAFAGSANYVSVALYMALATYLLGLFSCGMAIGVGYHITLKNQEALNTDYGSFMYSKISIADLVGNANKRNTKTKIGLQLGWLSFILFVIGIITSVYAYSDFHNEKQKAIQETQKREFSAKQKLSTDEKPDEKTNGASAK